MKYITIFTSRHHDGFAISIQSFRLNIVQRTPYGKDPLNSCDEAHKQGNQTLFLLFAA